MTEFNSDEDYFSLPGQSRAPPSFEQQPIVSDGRPLVHDGTELLAEIRRNPRGVIHAAIPQRRQQEPSTPTSSIRRSSPSIPLPKAIAFPQQQQYSSPPTAASPPPPPPPSIAIDIQRTEARPNEAERFASGVVEKLHTLGDRKKTWIICVAGTALALALLLGVFLFVLHASHQKLSERVENYAKAVQLLANKTPNATTPSPISDAFPSSSSKKRTTEPPNAKRYPHEDDMDTAALGGQKATTRGPPEERWSSTAFSLGSSSYVDGGIFLVEWKQEPRFDSIVAYGICCRLHSNETLVCASESDALDARLERASDGVGTKLIGRLRESSPGVPCVFRHLSKQR